MRWQREPEQAGVRTNTPATFLDSGFRRTAPGILPSRRIQDFLSINGGGGKD